MLYTLNLNPAIDMNIVSADLTPNVTTHTQDMVLTANGKGINVAFVLNKFGKNVGIIGFFGGFTGRYIVEECKRKGADMVHSHLLRNKGRAPYNRCQN